MKKILTLIAALSLVASLAVGGSIAWLSDTKSDVNVMTMGSVYIEQFEKDENGKDFANQPLYPGQTIHKHVTVENTGKSDAYVRTFIALEKGANVIEVKKNTTDWTWSDTTYDITVNNSEFTVYEAVYNTVLAPKTTTPDSLQTVSMKAEADNADVETFGDEYEVLALSQAVQTVGFDNAAAAFTASFQNGVALTAEMVKGWFDTVKYPTNTDSTEVQDLKALLAGAAEGDELYITLTSDVEYATEGTGGVKDVTKASRVVIDGANRYKITFTGSGVTAFGDDSAPIILRNLTVKDNSVSYAENSWEFSYLEVGGADLRFQNVTFLDPIMVESEKADFVNCDFTGYFDETNNIEMNGVWMINGSATFTDCTFTGVRGMKICDMYSNEVDTVVIDKCTFIGLTKKPGVAIDDENTQDMKITIKNSTFVDCQAGDQGLYIYETDNTVPTLENNVVRESIVDGLYQEGDTYYVSNANGLNYFSNKSLANANIKLIADIDMNNAEFSAMSAARGKSLTFNGNGHTISNVKVVSGSNDNTTGMASMFYSYPKSTLNVSNLKLENLTVTADNNDTGYAAAVVGYCEGATTLNDVDVINADITGSKSSGALVGHLSDGSSLNASNCDVSATVTLTDYEAKGHYAGKYIGTIAAPATLSDCTASVTIGGNLNAANVGDAYGRMVEGGSLN